MLQGNPLQKTERQTNFRDIQENPQQFILSSLPEVDMSRNSDSTSHTSFPDIDKNLQYSRQFLCDQEGISNCQSNPSSDYSTSEIWLQEEATRFQSEILFCQEKSLQSYNTFVIEYIENINSRKYHSCSPSKCLFS